MTVPFVPAELKIEFEINYVRNDATICNVDMTTTPPPTSTVKQITKCKLGYVYIIATVYEDDTISMVLKFATKNEHDYVLRIGDLQKPFPIGATEADKIHIMSKHLMINCEETITIPANIEPVIMNVRRFKPLDIHVHPMTGKRYIHYKISYAKRESNEGQCYFVCDSTIVYLD